MTSKEMKKELRAIEEQLERWLDVENELVVDSYTAKAFSHLDFARSFCRLSRIATDGPGERFGLYKRESKIRRH